VDQFLSPSYWVSVLLLSAVFLFVRWRWPNFVKEWGLRASVALIAVVFVVAVIWSFITS